MAEMTVFIKNPDPFFQSNMNSAILAASIDVLDFLLANVILYNTLKKNHRKKKFNNLMLIAALAWWLFTLTSLVTDAAAIIFGVNLWVFPNRHPVWIMFLVRFLTYYGSIMCYQLLTIHRFSKLVQNIRPYPKFVDYLLILIAVLINSLFVLPALFDYLCALLDDHWWLDDNVGFCNNLIITTPYPTYGEFYSLELLGALIQVFGIPIFETLLGFSLLLIVIKVDKISKIFKKASKGYDVQSIKIKKIKKEIKVFCIVWLCVVWVAGIINIIAQSNWVIYLFSDDDVMNFNYYGFFNSFGNLLVGVEFAFYFQFMEKLTALATVGREKLGEKEKNGSFCSVSQDDKASRTSQVDVSKRKTKTMMDSKSDIPGLTGSEAAEESFS